MGCAESVDAQTPNNNIQAETKPNTVKPVAKKQAPQKAAIKASQVMDDPMENP